MLNTSLMKIITLLILQVILSFSQTTKTIPEGDNLIDADGNVYKTIVLGDQIWLAENLKCRHNLDEEKINFYEYNNDPNLSKLNGLLYNQKTITNNVIADGWKIPDQKDWERLIEYLGGIEKAGEKLVSLGFIKHFSGMRDFTNVFQWINFKTCFVSSSKMKNAIVCYYIEKNNPKIQRGVFHPEDAFSVRLIKTK